MRVAVTTTADNVVRFASRLEAVGLEPVSLPCIRVIPSPNSVLEPLRRAAEEADWIVATSARAIAITWPDRMPSLPWTAVVGHATAAAVQAAEGRVGLVGTGGAASLRSLLKSRVAGKVVVFPHSRSADPATAQELRDGGAHVIAAPAYRTEAIAPDLDPVDAVILGSPSAVDGWLRSRNLVEPLIAAIGETTAAAIRARGYEPAIVPPTPDLDAVIEALAHRAQQTTERTST